MKTRLIMAMLPLALLTGCRTPPPPPAPQSTSKAPVVRRPKRKLTAEQADEAIRNAYEMWRRLAEEYPDSPWSKRIPQDTRGDYWTPEEKQRIIKGKEP